MKAWIAGKRRPGQFQRQEATEWRSRRWPWIWWRWQPDIDEDDEDIDEDHVKIMKKIMMKIMMKNMMVEAATEVLTKSPQPNSRPSLLFFLMIALARNFEWAYFGFILGCNCWPTVDWIKWLDIGKSFQLIFFPLRKWSNLQIDVLLRLRGVEVHKRWNQEYEESHIPSFVDLTLDVSKIGLVKSGDGDLKWV